MIQNKTPYELLYQSPADYSLFRVFGCLAFASTLSAHRTKFQPLARMCVFFGYPSGIKGYRLYDIQTKQIFISRDVIFHEDVFPFHTLVSSKNLIDPFPDLVLPHSGLDVPPAHFISPSSSVTQAEFEATDSVQDVHVTPLTDTTATSTVIPARKSTRPVKPPSYLRDYHCSLVSHKTLPNSTSSYPLSKFLSASHRVFVSVVSSHFEPQFFHQAVRFQH